MRLNPRTHAIRPDLADIRLAEYVFAPHYAAPLVMEAHRAAALRVAPGEEAEILCTLEPGAPFEVLEISAGLAWGIAPERKLVGYVSHDALHPLGNDRTPGSLPA